METDPKDTENKLMPKGRRWGWGRSKKRSEALTHTVTRMSPENTMPREARHEATWCVTPSI